MPFRAVPAVNPHKNQEGENSRIPPVCQRRYPGIPFSIGKPPHFRWTYRGTWAIRRSLRAARGNGPVCKNGRSSPFRDPLRPFFRQQNTPACSNARKQAVSTHFSRSPDLRIHSRRTAFSRLLPMADFRHVRGLHAYSGGTVPDSNRIHYSPRNPVGIPAALKRFSIALMILLFLGFVKRLSAHCVRARKKQNFSYSSLQNRIHLL